MEIEGQLFAKYISKILKAGLLNLENTPFYYDLVNNEDTRKFLTTFDGATNHFHFLTEVLDKQELTKCPECGHYNDNIECPILRCDYCDHEWTIKTEHSDGVCGDCVASITNHCNGRPKKQQETHD